MLSNAFSKTHDGLLEFQRDSSSELIDYALLAEVNCIIWSASVLRTREWLLQKPVVSSPWYSGCGASQNTFNCHPKKVVHSDMLLSADSQVVFTCRLPINMTITSEPV